jgi:membrane associated rhomboid family serine protease
VQGRGHQTSFGPPVTPQIIKNLMIANAVIFIAQFAVPLVYQYGVVTPEATWVGLQLWRPFTYMWLHGGPMHLAFNMLALWMFGSALALYWGEQRFLRYYLVCGVGAGVLIATVPWLPVIAGWNVSFGPLGAATLGASGAVMGVLLAFSFTWPDRTIQLLFPPIPLKAIWLIPLLLFFELFSGPSNVSHVGHLGGVLVGWIYLVREGRTPGAPNLRTLKLRYQRYTMRKKLRAVHDEARREREGRGPKDRGPGERRNDDRTYH